MSSEAVGSVTEQELDGMEAMCQGRGARGRGRVREYIICPVRRINVRMMTDMMIRETGLNVHEKTCVLLMDVKTSIDVFRNVRNDDTVIPLTAPLQSQPCSSFWPRLG